MTKLKGLLLTGLLFAMMCVCGTEVSAASANVQFSTNTTNVAEGSSVTVVCRVSSQDGFRDVDMEVEYDSEVLEFVKGGKKVTGSGGVLHIKSANNADTVKNRTYSLKFKALKQGVSSVQINDNASISNESGEGLSISSNCVNLSVGAGELEEPERGAAASSVMGSTASPMPSATPEPNLNKNTKLQSLQFNCIAMSPQFNNDVKDYTVNVDYNTDSLFFRYDASNSKQKVRMKDGTDLVPGENKVKVVVTAESGDKRTFNINVVKESEAETKVREQQEKGTSDIVFSLYEKNGSIFIQNEYQFEVVDVEDDGVLPSGYVKSSVDLEGKTVTAYTMANDLDNNYLLMYLKGASGKPTLYQYDRQEKTLQRYTGTMTQKVNQGGNVANNATIKPSTWLYGVIVGLSVLIIALLIVILNMVLKRKLGKGKKELDDTDF